MNLIEHPSDSHAMQWLNEQQLDTIPDGVYHWVYRNTPFVKIFTNISPPNGWLLVIGMVSGFGFATWLYKPFGISHWEFFAIIIMINKYLPVIDSH